MKSRSLFNVLNLVLAGGLSATLGAPVHAEPGEDKSRSSAAAAAEVDSSASPSAEPAPAAADESVTPAAAPAAFLGVAVAEAATPAEAASAADRDPRLPALVVSQVQPDSPADQAGLRSGDLLLALDDQQLLHPVQLRRLVAVHDPGSSTRFTIFRDGRVESLEITLAQRPAELGQAMPQHGLHRFFDQDAAMPHMLMPELDAQFEQMRKDMEQRLQQFQLQLRPPGNAPAPGNALAPSGPAFQSTITRIDDEHRVTVTTTPQGHHLKALDNEGNVLFDGPIDTDEQRQAVPEAVREKLPELKDLPAPRPADQQAPIGRAV